MWCLKSFKTLYFIKPKKRSKTVSFTSLCYTERIHVSVRSLFFFFFLSFLTSYTLTFLQNIIFRNEIQHKIQMPVYSSNVKHIMKPGEFTEKVLCARDSESNWVCSKNGLHIYRPTTQHHRYIDEKRNEHTF